MPKSPCGEELVPYIQNEGKVTGRWGQMESDLYACSKCGYQVFLPLPSNEQLGQYYGSQYWELSGSLAEAKEAYAGGNYSWAAEELMKIWESHGQSVQARIHEIGCGYGAAVHFLNKLGANATGSDLSDSAPQVAKSLGNDKTVSMDLDEYLKQNPKHGINYFYMSHSLEHFPKPETVVNSVFNALEVGGLYVIRVPNGMHITSRLRSEYENTWLQYPDHIHYFTPKSAICLLEKQGFEIVEITTRLREDHPDQMVTASLGLSFKQLPDYISYLKGLCDNWLGMELQIIARKPQKGTKLVSDDLVAKANAFENGAKDLEVAKILPSQNSVEFNSHKDDEYSWKYFEKIASSLVDFKKHEDGKKLYTENGLQVQRALWFIPAGRTIVARKKLSADINQKTKLAKFSFSSFLAHDEDGEYILRFLRNDKQFETFTVKGQKRYSHEWYFTAQKNDVFKVEIEVVKSFWPSIYAHANLDWLEVKN